MAIFHILTLKKGPVPWVAIGVVAGRLPYKWEVKWTGFG